VQSQAGHGARVIGVVRKGELYEGQTNSKSRKSSGVVTDVASAEYASSPHGKGAEHRLQHRLAIPICRRRIKSLALRGRKILIAAVDRIVQLNIMDFIAAQTHLCGHHRYARPVGRSQTGAVLRKSGMASAAGISSRSDQTAAITAWNSAKAALSRVAVINANGCPAAGVGPPNIFCHCIMRERNVAFGWKRTLFF